MNTIFDYHGIDWQGNAFDATQDFFRKSVLSDMTAPAPLLYNRANLQIRINWAEKVKIDKIKEWHLTNLNIVPRINRSSVTN